MNSIFEALITGLFVAALAALFYIYMNKED